MEDAPPYIEGGEAAKKLWDAQHEVPRSMREKRGVRWEPFMLEAQSETAYGTSRRKTEQLVCWRLRSRRVTTIPDAVV